MAQYTVSLTSDQNLAGRTEWKPTKPALFIEGDQITFTSPDGDWDVQFADSPFQPTAMLQNFSGQAKESQTATLRDGRIGVFPFRCALTAGGKPTKWTGGGDDIRT